MKITCANPGAQFRSHQEEIEEALINVAKNNNYILGNEVRKFEEEFSNYIGTKDAIGVASGTDAIEVVLRSLDIGHGDEVITVSHTAVATVAAIEACGATPVLIDVDPRLFTINPLQLEEVFNQKTKAVIAVHLYGQAADLEELLNFCQKKNIYLIEDVSQAHGAKYKNKRIGQYGIAACFSCYPTKNLGALGDAGVITSNDSDLSKKCRSIRQYGWEDKFISSRAGRCSRLDEIQAAILRIKLKYLDTNNEKRIINADFYNRGLKDLDLKLPLIGDSRTHVYHQYVLLTDKREDLIKHLNNKNIFPGIHYPVPIHMQPAYRLRIKTAKNMIITESICKNVLSLPIYPELTQEDKMQVISSITEFFNR